MLAGVGRYRPQVLLAARLDFGRQPDCQERLVAQPRDYGDYLTDQINHFALVANYKLLTSHLCFAPKYDITYQYEN